MQVINANSTHSLKQKVFVKHIIIIMDIFNIIQTTCLLLQLHRRFHITSRNFIFAGDLVAEFPYYYGIMVARGFFSPYIQNDGRCTFCYENPLSPFPENVIIDHVYITTDTVERVMRAEVSCLIFCKCMHYKHIC